LYVKTGNFAEDLAAEILATTLGTPFDSDVNLVFSLVIT